MTAAGAQLARRRVAGPLHGRFNLSAPPPPLQLFEAAKQLGKQPDSALVVLLELHVAAGKLSFTLWGRAWGSKISPNPRSVGQPGALPRRVQRVPRA